ncbi:hypothetical protein LU276_08645 [Moraxella haemolytica]|uniref:hypothetical protein n=1 Tax=Moraxella TaxID=475 RepID=UPI002543B54E|nr:hypothetical protein [Moraxella sp. ZY171148]WII95062.1 hypothetical protein LU276_08645 [Moraxella sp. ZY171148]
MYQKAQVSSKKVCDDGVLIAIWLSLLAPMMSSTVRHALGFSWSDTEFVLCI